MKIKKNIAISDTGFIFDPASGESFSLNPIALEILNMIKEDASKEVIQQNVTNKYEVDLQTFEHNYYDFIGMLKKFNLLEDEKEF